MKIEIYDYSFAEDFQPSGYGNSHGEGFDNGWGYGGGYCWSSSNNDGHLSYGDGYCHSAGHYSGRMYGYSFEDTSKVICR